LCAWICGCPDDDNIQNSYYYEVPDLVSIKDNSHLYQQNDTLFLNIKIPRNISTSATETVDIFELTQETQQAYTIISMFKETNIENPQPILLSLNEIITFNNDINMLDNRLEITSSFQNDFYESKVGIILRETGSFFITGIYSEQKSSVYANISGIDGSYVFIDTSIIDANSENQFAFTVN
jgi:hypothetical protein